eukprot:m.194890 g.194890  ORF g.194890 m.194890 type:complete len:175 (+) comp18667_c0_seq1:206-730(+)
MAQSGVWIAIIFIYYLTVCSAKKEAHGAVSDAKGGQDTAILYSGSGAEPAARIGTTVSATLDIGADAQPRVDDDETEHGKKGKKGKKGESGKAGGKGPNDALTTQDSSVGTHTAVIAGGVAALLVSTAFVAARQRHVSLQQERDRDVVIDISPILDEQSSAIDEQSHLLRDAQS